MKPFEPSFSRRDYLKTTALISGTLGLSGMFLGRGPLFAQAPFINPPVSGLNDTAGHSQDPISFELSFPAMGSLLHVRWFDSIDGNRTRANDLAEVVQEQSEQIAEHWNSVMSDYDRESQASVVAGLADRGEWVEVSSDLGEVIEACDRWNQLSDGAFDASIGAITKLRRRRELASPQQWASAQNQVGWGNLIWDKERRRLRFKKPGVRFDFGAIGKGWVVDRIFEALQAKGLDCCSVDFSGNMRLGNPPPNSTGWPISIDCCFADDSTNAEQFESPELIRLRLSNRSISTSGNRWQMLPDGNSRTKQDTSSHIIDPKSLDGLRVAQNVTILAETASDADAASTATSVLASGDLASWLLKLREESPLYSWLIQICDGRTRRVTSNL